MQTLEFAPGLFIDLAGIDPDAPLIVWFHGGGWRLQDRTARPDFDKHFLPRGFSMASIDYRLAPAHPHPAQVEDALSAIAFLREEVGAQHIGLWGSSAGAHVAIMAALQGAPVDCVVGGYGPTDIAALLPDNPTVAPDRGPTPEQDLFGGPDRVTEEAARAASPIAADATCAPPMLLMHGTADNLVPCSQSVALHEHLTAAGRESTLVLVDGLGHGFFNPGDVLELGPGVRLDNGRLEREPNRPFEATQSPAATFEFGDHRADHTLVADFFDFHLRANS